MQVWREFLFQHVSFCVPYPKPAVLAYRGKAISIFGKREFCHLSADGLLCVSVARILDAAVM